MTTNIRSAAIWLIVLFLASAQRSTNPPADLLILNGKVYTSDGSGTFQEAVAVRGDRIVAVGTAADISGLRGSSTEAVDAHGAAVMPGFNDVHTHMLSGGLEMDNVDSRLLCSGQLRGERVNPCALFVGLGNGKTAHFGQSAEGRIGGNPRRHK